MGTLILSVVNEARPANQPGYLPVLIIAFLVLCYLVYAVSKPEKF